MSHHLIQIRDCLHGDNGPALRRAAAYIFQRRLTAKLLERLLVLNTPL